MLTDIDSEVQQQRVEIPRWTIPLRVAFRFCFVYFGLLCLTTQVLGGLFQVPKLDIPDPASLWPVRPMVFWTAAHIFGVKTPLIYQGSGSGDKTFDWVLVFCLLIIAALATIVWSILDRRCANYAALYKWFRLFIRFALASQMILYGVVKIVPLQMPFPFLTRLLEPYGDFSPMGVLWSSVGASPSYEIFTGCAETLAGIFLTVPRTTFAGALICVVDLTEIFVLNMTYDVPVKLFSFNLLLLALFLLAPDFRRIWNFLFLNRTVEAIRPQLFRTRRGNRIALAAQVLFGLWLLGTNAYGSRRAWFEYGGGRAKPPIYGIWDVDEMSVDGKMRSPLLNDFGRWRRAIFDFEQVATFQRMDDSFVYFGAEFNSGRGTLTLTKYGDKNWKANFRFRREAQDRLLLDGEMDQHAMHLQLRLVDLKKFVLTNSGFHWIQEYPFNR